MGSVAILSPEPVLGCRGGRLVGSVHRSRRIHRRGLLDRLLGENPEEQDRVDADASLVQVWDEAGQNKQAPGWRRTRSRR